MAKDTLPPETPIELVAIKSNQVHKQTMPYAEALKIPKKTGWIDKFYEIGFCSMKQPTK